MHEGWALLSQIGLWGWVVCMCGFILGSFGKENVFNSRNALIWGSGSVMLFVIWVAGMSLA